MAYSSGGLIQASDYNTRATSINQLWGTGSGNYGYGQSTTISQTQTSGTVVPASDWATMIARMSTMQQHQFNNTTGVPAQPSAGGIITYLSAVDTEITSLQNNRFTTYTTTSSGIVGLVTNATTWHTSSVKTWTIAFTNDNSARYFFNAGGSISLYSDGNTMSPATWNSFANTGYAYSQLYATSFLHAGTVGTYTRSVYNSGQGFYNLTSTPATFLTLLETGTGNANYNNNSISVAWSYNGTGTLTATLTFLDNDANAFGYNVTGSTYGRFNLYYPETTYLTNTWGTPTITNTVNTQA
jgi:hypothetical protein